MAEAKRRAKRAVPPRNVNTLLIEEAFATWLPPAVGAVILGATMLLDALGLIAEPIAALSAVFALLILGISTALGSLLRDAHPRLGPVALAGVALAWIIVFALPFSLRLFPGPPVATTSLEAKPANPVLPIGEGRFDLVLDAHLPPATEHQTRQLHYALTLTDGAGQSQHYDGELGDQWQTRRLGRRGTAPVHLEHLSATHEVDYPAGGTVRLDDVAVSGIPEASVAASFYHRRVPGLLWLLGGGILLGIAALTFDLWWDPQRTPTAALLTATATGAVVVFCSSAAGHPGLRQVFGSTIVGGIAGVPTIGIVAWLVRRFPALRRIAPGRAT
ncbi:MAG: hypothetical protein ABIR79_04680 [Candidatus Binatia bacterium]